MSETYAGLKTYQIVAKQQTIIEEMKRSITNLQREVSWRSDVMLTLQREKDELEASAPSDEVRAKAALADEFYKATDYYERGSWDLEARENNMDFQEWLANWRERYGRLSQNQEAKA